ncbi:MAG: recombinase family protein [Eubacterium sp.]|nr:recombinase family protein [Eubacterium sp.]
MEVELIKASPLFNNDSSVRKERMRVAAYCRVSTDEEEQLKSYDSMVQYYTDLIKKNSEWVFAGVYADKATTGTKVLNREEFQKLINDCMVGRIDMVLAKSLSRFARNTLDTLKYVRMLKEKGIAVYFEVEKINTLKDGEFLMTILSSVAQQEVENTSAYVKKGLKMKMKRGEMVGFQGCTGYKYDPVTKTISVDEDGAEIVRYIFDRYVAGAGSTVIARELNQMGLTTIRGNPWSNSSVIGVVKNEKYTGDLLMGKTFTVDPLSKRRLENRGEEDKYLIKNHHEAIITKEKFEEAQAMLSKRNGNRKKGVVLGHRQKYSRQYAFSCMIKCAFCGANLTRRTWHTSSKYKKITWQCVESSKKGRRFCPDSKAVPESIIEEAFVESYRLLCSDNKSVLDDFLKKVESALNSSDISLELEKLKKSESRILQKRKKLLDGFLENAIDKETFKEEDYQLKIKLSKLEEKIDKCCDNANVESDTKKRIEDFRKLLSKNEIMTEFDRAIFESIVEEVIVGGYDEEGNKDPYRITFIYKTGFTDSINKSKTRYKQLPEGKSGSLYSYKKDESNTMLSYNSDNTCGDDCRTTKSKFVTILEFTHFVDYNSFIKISENHKEKIGINKFTVVVAFKLETGDTNI